MSVVFAVLFVPGVSKASLSGCSIKLDSILGEDIAQLGSGNDLGPLTETNTSQDSCLIGEVKLFAANFSNYKTKKSDNE